MRGPQLCGRADLFGSHLRDRDGGQRARKLVLEIADQSHVKGRREAGPLCVRESLLKIGESGLLKTNAGTESDGIEPKPSQQLPGGDGLQEGKHRKASHEILLGQSLQRHKGGLFIL